MLPAMAGGGQRETGRGVAVKPSGLPSPGSTQQEADTQAHA